MQNGLFRRDLYFRLAGFTVTIPPLRKRKEDIALLAEHFLKIFALEMGYSKSKLSPQALALLEDYDYPGNIRELKNIIENSLIRSQGTTIFPQHLNFIQDSSLFHEETTISNSQKISKTPQATSSLGEEEKIIQYLQQYGSINNTQCRDLLDIDYHHVSYLLKKLNNKGLLVQIGKRRGTAYHLP